MNKFLYCLEKLLQAFKYIDTEQVFLSFFSPPFLFPMFAMLVVVLKGRTQKGAMRGDNGRNEPAN